MSIGTELTCLEKNCFKTKMKKKPKWALDNILTFTFNNKSIECDIKKQNKY